MVGLDPATQTLPHIQNSKQPTEPDQWVVGSSPTMERFVQTKINLAEKLTSFSDYFSPRTIAQYNNSDIMVVKAKGDFPWHKHDETDDFFLVLKGTLIIELKDEAITLGPGEMYIVPKGVEHRTVANEEVHLLLIEPTGTPNTGDTATAAKRKLA